MSEFSELAWYSIYHIAKQAPNFLETVEHSIVNAHFEFNYASEISDTKIVIIALIVSEFSEQRTLWHCDKQAFDFLNQ